MGKVLVGLALLLIATPTYADGGGPLLLIVNFMLFTYGQVWILSIETIAFRKVFINSRLIQIFKWVFFANLASTLLGALLAPLLWAAIFGFLGKSLWENEIGKILFAVGTLIAGDNSPHPKLAIGVTIIGFVVTYLLTVYIENWVFRRAIFKKSLPNAANLLKNCYVINGISYIGLIILFFVFSDW